MVFVRRSPNMGLTIGLDYSIGKCFNALMLSLVIISFETQIFSQMLFKWRNRLVVGVSGI